MASSSRGGGGLRPNEPTTPMVKRRLGAMRNLAIHSTPASAGTPRDAKHKHDGRESDANAAMIKADLDNNTQVVSLWALLKAMIMIKYNKEDKLADANPLSLEELHEYGDTQMGLLMDKAVEFCNDKARSKKLVETLDKVAVTTTENGRYHPLVTGLNSILLDFRNTDVGNLTRCAEDDLTLYNIGENMVIDSKELSQTSLNHTQRKPDIYESRYKDLLRLTPGCGDLSMEALATLMELKPDVWSELSKDKKTAGKTEWSDLIYCIEVKKDKSVWKQLPSVRWEQGKYTAEVRLDNENPTNPALPLEPQDGKAGLMESGTSKSSIRKRGRAGSDEAVRPKPKKSRTKAKTFGVNTKLDPLNSGKHPDVQCGYYALELLRSRWDRTHSIVMLFSGKSQTSG
ncbi:hypothetical protein D9611_009442 [Ephemerocybe angulata]|uniref:Uncharacterized protein n=1 Tax=Ephemerocybe angulata TaxID=980116 RepID=A0A8H5AVQ9_9AGAR|nr:hypothetical protein D9611_009442 [Tulosesus angulatus]